MLSTAADVDVLPAVPAHTSNPIHSSTPIPPTSVDEGSSSSSLPRSASYTHLPSVREVGVESGLKRTFSENVLSLPPDPSLKSNGLAHTANKELFRRASRKAKKKLSAARFSVSPDESTQNASVNSDSRRGADNVERAKPAGRSVANTFRHLARKSWISASSRSA